MGIEWTNEMSLRLLYSAVVVAVLFVIKIVANRWVYKRVHEPEKSYRIKKGTNTLLVVLAIIILGFLWSQHLGSLSTFLGLLSAGLAIALRDFLVNFFAWIFIVTRRPFDVGDRISISGMTGDVIDLRIFEFTMLEVDEKSGEQSTGSLIHMPNARVIAEPLTNQTRGFGYVWSEVQVLLTFESNWRLAKDRFQALIDEQNHSVSKAAENSLKKASQRYFMYYSNLTPIVYTSVEESGVRLTIRFLCEPRQKRMEMERLWESVLNEIEKEPSIELAYPTSRVIRMEG